MTKGARYEIGRGDTLYPPSLDGMRRQPDRLYVVGDPTALHGSLVAVIGSRRASDRGIEAARAAARCAAEAGLGVVTGSALGCDMVAQRAALDAGAKVVAVLGCGADVAYPGAAEADLQDVVDAGGAVVSLLPWGDGPFRWAFLERNAVTAALASSVVVAEAGLPSGTFRCACLALEMGRPVLALHAQGDGPRNDGCRDLLGLRGVSGVPTVADGGKVLVDREALSCALAKLAPGRNVPVRGEEGVQR